MLLFSYTQTITFFNFLIVCCPPQLFIFHLPFQHYRPASPLCLQLSSILQPFLHSLFILVKNFLIPSFSSLIPPPPCISFLLLLLVFVARHPSVSPFLSLLSNPSLLLSLPASPSHPSPPCLSFSPRRQYFLGRSPGYSSQGIRGPPPGEDVEVTMEVALGAYHHPSIYFGC